MFLNRVNVLVVLTEQMIVEFLKSDHTNTGDCRVLLQTTFIYFAAKTLQFYLFLVE
jgi:hypothetical protein